MCRNDPLVKVGAENFILRTEGGAQNLLKYATTPKSLHFKVLAPYPFCTHRAAHGLTVVVWDQEWLLCSRLHLVLSEC